MFALQALIPSSKFIAERKVIDDFDSPEIGGYEMGTWGFGSYLHVFEAILGYSIWPDDKNKHFEQVNKFQIAHRFTEEECAKIFAALSSVPITQYKKTKTFVADLSGFFKIKRDKTQVKEKYFVILKNLFANPNDLPIHICS